MRCGAVLVAAGRSARMGFDKLLATLDGRQQIAARRRGDATAQQRDPVRPPVQRLDDRSIVLLGENFGRRHERHLIAVLHRDDRRQQRDDGLAGADVAL